MNTNKKFLFFLIGLLLTFLVPNFGWAAVWTANTAAIPAGALTDGGRRVNICHATSSSTNPFVQINISVNGLKGHSLHNDDEFLINGKCGSTGKSPALNCGNSKIYKKSNNSCIAPPSGNADAPTILDDNGVLLDFSPDSGSYPTLLSGTDRAVGAVYEYKNVVTVNGVQVDALVKIDKAVAAAVDTIDDPAPNGGNSYTVSSGNPVPDKSVFGPRVKATSANGYVDFLIAFQDTSGNPITLNNVYNNSIDIDGPELVEYGGFVSYEMASTTHLIAAVGSDGVKRKFTGTGNYGGLELNDYGRVQTKFDSMSTLVISMGATAQTSGNKLANIDGRSSYGRQYGSIFVKHNLSSPVAHTPPTVNFQTTTNLKPTITGTKGTSTGVSIVIKNAAGASTNLGNATISGSNWSVIPSSNLAPGIYDVIATGNNDLLDQTIGELTILLSCTAPNVLNAAGTACDAPVQCFAPFVRDVATNTCVLQANANKACTKITHPIPNPMPEGAIYDDKKVTICHFPPGNPENVQIISISWNAFLTHVNQHGDTFYQTGKMCPSSPTDCDDDNPPPQSDIPTVNPQTTSDTTPILTGTIGVNSMANGESFRVTVNGVVYPWSTSGNSGNIQAGSVVIEGTTWILQTSTPIPAGTYDVKADRGTKSGNSFGSVTSTDETTGELTILPTCTNTQAFQNGQCKELPIPTVISQETEDTTPTVTGTVGNIPLASGEDFHVVLHDITYTNGDGKLSVNGLNWTLQVATPLPVGLYDVTATRENGLEDITLDELRILPMCTATQVLINNVCSERPTVVSQSTTDTTPTITGTVGSVVLSAGEPFSVEVNGTTYNKGVSNLVINGTTWTLNITTPLAVGVYNVDAVRNTVPDTTSSELTITGTVPTVTSQKTNDTTPVILGTYGATALGANESFSVIVNGVTYNKGDGNLVTLASNWSLTIPDANALKIGTYNVDAVRNGNLHDVTSGELIIEIQAPTVIPKTVKEKEPIELKGTVGDVALNGSETFTVQVNSKTYTKGDGNLVVNALNWTLNIPSADLITILAANSPYDVVATRSGTLIDTTTGELIIEKLNPPTVESQETFDTTPVIKGTVGETELATNEAFTVTVNNKTYTLGTDNNLLVSSKNWILTILAGSEILSKAQPYDVTATRAGTIVDTTSGELTIKPCALPKVVNAAGTECIAPVPTVVPQVIETNLTATPVIHGTVGEVALGSTETFAVKIGTAEPQTYDKGNNALVISGSDWTLTVPAAKAILPGTYNVDAIRNTTAIDITEKELVINLVCLTGQVQVNGSCASSSTLPTVNPLSTDDRTPTLTGTVGTTDLSAGEAFSVTIEGTGRTYILGTSPELSVTGKTWSLAVPRPPLTPTTYSITATRAENIVDTTSNELTISAQCIPPNIEEDGDCIAAVKIPTVNHLVTDISTQTIEVSGTVGNVALVDNESFTVKIHNAEHSNVACSVLITGKTWTCTLTSKPFVAGIFDVDATRAAVLDETSGELTITDNITICENNVTTSIPKTSWDGTKVDVNYYLGACTEHPLVCKPCGDAPDEPQSLVPQKTVAESPYCDDGGKRSEVAATGVTIKRATIINGTTVNGSLMSLNNAKVTYGEKASAIGNMDIRNATIGVNAAACPTGMCAVPGSTATSGSTTSGATNVELSNVTLENAYIESSGSFNINTGVFTPSDSWIGVSAGTTSPTNESTPLWLSTIISGIITAGTDTSGSPIRGNINSGRYNVSVTNAERVTKSRRIKGKIVGATVTNATTMTSGGITYITSGTITSGTFEGDFTAYGTVTGATIVGTNLSSSNHCFSSGTVGNKGQLNWKEVVK